MSIPFDTTNTSAKTPISIPTAPPEAVATYWESISATFAAAWESTTAVPGKLYDALPTVCGETCTSVSTTASTYFNTVKDGVTSSFDAAVTAITPADDSVIRTVASFGSSTFQTIAPVVAGGVLANSTISMLQGKANIQLQNPEMKKALIATAVAGLAIYMNQPEGRLLQVASLLAASTAVGIYKAYTAVAPIYIMLPEGLTFDDALPTVEDIAEEAPAETAATDAQASVQVEQEALANG